MRMVLFQDTAAGNARCSVVLPGGEMVHETMRAEQTTSFSLNRGSLSSTCHPTPTASTICTNFLCQHDPFILDLILPVSLCISFLRVQSLHFQRPAFSESSHVFPPASPQHDAALPSHPAA